jgi:zinc finger protein
MAKEEQPKIDKLEGQLCPMCNKKTLTLLESDAEVPYFGKMYVFSMDCSSCNFHKADVEAEQVKEPSRFTFEINSEDDMKVRVVKSSAATVKLPHVMTITPGPASNGYITNVEGIMNRVKSVIEETRDTAEEDTDRKKAKNLLKKLQNVMWGREALKLIIEDPTGNSAIISEKAVKEKIKGKSSDSD